jgi:NAD(P)-dependent dehydrogenase (short-subunit alcohol dehydrogenase family)
MNGRADKIVLVTGGSGGIGAAIAGQFAMLGCHVVIAARDYEKLAAAAAKIAENGAQVRAIACDVTRRDAIQSLRHTIQQHWGDVQILVNNAGIARAVSFADMSDETWDQTLATNLTGAYNCCKVFLPAMIEAKWGRIINIASTAAKVGFSHVTAYSASKHGLLGLTRSLALETARLGVTVNAICPGYVDDARTRENARIMAEKTGKSVDDILKVFAASAPQNRLIEAAEVAALACLIASPEMSGMTGQAINVDGGAVMS